MKRGGKSAKSAHKPKKALDEGEKKVEEYTKLLKKVQADFENYKKRAEKEQADSRKFANQLIVEEFLEVRDNLERALSETEDPQSVVEGVRLTLKQLDSLLKKHGVEEVNPVGEVFDPRYHEALMATDGEGDKEMVAQVLQKGYMLHSRVVRPAKVKITKPREGE